MNRLHQFRIQEWSADLQAAGHAGAVHLVQDVFGEVRVLIKGEGAGQRWIGEPVKRLELEGMLTSTQAIPQSLRVADQLSP